MILHASSKSGIETRSWRNKLIGDIERRFRRDPTTALELDEIQVLRCNEDIRVMMDA